MLPPPAIVRGIDHVPLAVRDLAQTQRDFERLGFVIKPGRHHDDGIRNVHVKFADHTEIELITASAPVDRLSAEYAAFLRGGDGPESFSLYAPDLDALTARLTGLGVAPHNDGEIVTFAQASFPHRLFFADREPSPTDRPAYDAHANTAYHLEAIYATISSPERRLLTGLGASVRATRACAPFARDAETFAFADGAVVALAPTSRPESHSIVAAVVLVRDLRAVGGIVRRRGIAHELVTGCGPATLWIPPSAAHGLWLGFRAPTSLRRTRGVCRGG